MHIIGARGFCTLHLTDGYHDLISHHRLDKACHFSCIYMSLGSEQVIKVLYKHLLNINLLISPSSPLFNTSL